MKKIIFLVVVFALLVCGCASSDNQSEARIYICDYKTSSVLKTKIEITTPDNDILYISGDLFNVIEDPLTMTDKDGNSVAYAGDSYNLINQNDHGIYVNDDFVYDVSGDLSVFGNNYEIKDEDGNVIGTFEVNYFNTKGELYIDDVLVASYESVLGFNDFNIFIYPECTYDDKAVIMTLASQVSDFHADE